MGRYIDPVPQYSDLNGVPFPGGKVFFFDSGTSNPKTTFSDIALTVPNTNPVILDAEGRISDVFYEGDAKVVLKDADDVQIWERDPVTQATSTDVTWAPYDNTVTYSIQDIVRGSDDEYYISLTNLNLNNDPVIDTLNWNHIILLQDWNPNISYDISDNARGSDGNFYRSLINSNLNNDPINNPLQWTAAINPNSTELDTLLPPGYKQPDGLLISNAGGDPDHDLTISAGRAKDSINSIDIILNVAITKRIDNSWAEGTDQGGFPSVLSLSPDTWYHVFIIRRTADGNTDAGFDTSLSATNLLADATSYSEFRRVGSVLTDGSSNIHPFIQVKDRFFYDTAIIETTTAPGVSLEDIVISTPLDLQTFAVIAVTATFSGTTTTIYSVAIKGLTDNGYTACRGRSNAGGQFDTIILTDTNSTMQHSSDNTNAFLFETLGWIDPELGV